MTVSGANVFTSGSILIATMVTITATTQTPAGWTELLPATTIGTRQMIVWAKVRSAADGDTYSFTQTTGVAKKVTIAEILGTDSTIANIVVGTFRNRAGSGGTFTNIAPSVTTPVNNCLVLTLSGEATSATEANLPVVSGATKWYDAVQTSTSFIEQVTTATLDMPTAGATAAVNITYPNTQTANGGALQIVLRPAADVTPPAPVGAQISVWNGTTETKGSCWAEALAI
jgi:hypothetical protein